MTPIIDQEGFHYYRCVMCKKSKLAALFTPSEIATGVGITCRKCRGELNKKRYDEKNVPAGNQVWR